MARFKKNLYIPPDAPLLYESHGRPITRREFVRQGLITGSASMLAGGLFMNPAHALSTDLDTLASNNNCTLGGVGAGKIPFICFDLAGGANFAGSNVLVGQAGGQMDLLSTAGYSKLGLPGDMLPGQVDAGNLLNPSNGDFTNSDLNLMFHADSPLLFGILEKAGLAVGNIDGAVIPARSDNDTGNNPHNPLYALAMTGARGSVVDLIGSRASVSGGNSLSPAMYIDPEFTPTKIDRFSDVTGLVDVGDLTTILGANDVSAVMESIARATHKKLELSSIQTLLANNVDVRDLVRCGYLKAADIADTFGTLVVDPEADPEINDAVDPGITGIFTQNELDNDREFRKTASVMKMVLGGGPSGSFSAGGCISIGGYDYHTGDRRVGENRDLRAGRCIGACIDYARRVNKPLMVYVFSDGSVASNGNSDDTASTGAGENLVLGGQGKGEWTGDNSSTACSFFLVFNPGTPPALIGSRQIGHMSAGASVVTTATPAANNVNLLVNMLMLNYMALNGPTPGFSDVISEFKTIFPNHGLGSDANLASYISFAALP